MGGRHRVSDPGIAHQRGQPRRRVQRLARGQHQLRPGDQRQEHVAHRHIEGEAANASTTLPGPIRHGRPCPAGSSPPAGAPPPRPWAPRWNPRCRSRTPRSRASPRCRPGRRRSCLPIASRSASRLIRATPPAGGQAGGAGRAGDEHRSCRCRRSGTTAGAAGRPDPAARTRRPLSRSPAAAPAGPARSPCTPRRGSPARPRPHAAAGRSGSPARSAARRSAAGPVPGRAQAGPRSRPASCAAWAWTVSCTHHTGKSAAVSFHSVSSRRSSASVSTGSCESRADGSATTPRSSTSQLASSRSIVAGVEQPGLVGAGQPQPLAARLGGEVEVEPGRVALTTSRAGQQEVDPGRGHRGLVPLGIGHRELEHRRAARVPLHAKRLHQLAERQVLVRVAADGGLLDPGQQLGEGGSRTASARIGSALTR